MDIQNLFDKFIEEANQKYQYHFLDEAIVAYFGSEERAREMAKYFVIEEDPADLELNNDILYPGELRLRFTFKYKIRPKTLEELSRDRADEIIEKNTRILNTCIVCDNPILPEDNEVKTIHGYYHGAPFTCLDGRN